MDNNADYNSTDMSNISRETSALLERPTADPLQLTSDQLYQLLYVIYFWIQGVAYTVICTIGIFANLLNIVTLWRQRKLVTYKIFLAMAFADLVVVCVMLSYSLCFGVYSPIITTGKIGSPPNLGVHYTKYVWYYVWFHVQNTFMCISNWCVVLVAVFRLIVITFPLKAIDYASATRVNTAISLVYICSVLAQIPNYLTSKWENGVIVAVPESAKFAVFTYIINSPFPLFTCCLATITLIIMLRKQQQMVNKAIKKEQREERKRDHRQLTVTQLVILCFFLICNIPDVTYWLMNTTGAFAKNRISSYNINIFYLVSTLFTALNYSCNFFIYILANSSFRKDLKFVLTRCKNSFTGKKTKKFSLGQSTGISSLSDNHHHPLREISTTSGNKSPQVTSTKTPLEATKDGFGVKD